MDRNRDRRIARLEEQRAMFARTPPMVIAMDASETQEHAIARICGLDGLPPRDPRDVQHIFVRGVVPQPRDGAAPPPLRSGEDA